jgi:hypothetical protein
LAAIGDRGGFVGERGGAPTLEEGALLGPAIDDTAIVRDLSASASAARTMNAFSWVLGTAVFARASSMIFGARIISA